MKKMFFTAIALVAFSGVSMANTKEVKSIKPVIKAKTIKKSAMLRTYCDQVWINGYTYALVALHYEAGSADAWAYADARATALGC